MYAIDLGCFSFINAHTLKVWLTPWCSTFPVCPFYACLMFNIVLVYMT